MSETDGNGRVTTYTLGAYGQVQAEHTRLTGGIPVVTKRGKVFTFTFFGKTWTFKQPDSKRQINHTLQTPSPNP